MKAARLHELGKPLVVEEIPNPTLRPDGIIVWVLSSHIPPFTDQVLSGELGYALPLLPFTPYDNAVGVVEAVADDVFDLKVGQIVFCDPFISSHIIGGEPDAILADIVLDVLGGVRQPEPIIACINALRPKGTAVLMGGVKADVPLTLFKNHD